MKKALTVLAALGLVLAITGGAFAAKGLLTGADIKNGSLTGADVKDHTLGANLFTEGAQNSLTGDRGSEAPQELPAPTVPPASTDCPAAGARTARMARTVALAQPAPSGRLVQRVPARPEQPAWPERQPSPSLSPPVQQCLRPPTAARASTRLVAAAGPVAELTPCRAASRPRTVRPPQRRLPRTRSTGWRSSSPVRQATRRTQSASPTRTHSDRRVSWGGAACGPAPRAVIRPAVLCLRPLMSQSRLRV